MTRSANNNADTNDDAALGPAEGTEGMTAEQTVESLLDQASAMGASDLFIFTEEEQTTIAVRHLGILRPLATYPQQHARQFISLIKAQAGMDLAERRRPQDGRWVRTHANGHTTDLRVNVIPTLYGEDCTLRLLERDSTLRDLAGLGMFPRQRNELLSMLASPSGLVLVTGPTGSGKTTTLYAALNHLVDGVKKINTIEDPIEFAVDGLRQSQVNPMIDLDFPELLSSVLRQAPDVIMIGEVRDPTTARAAVRAANSGHLVFATLHAPIAAGAIDSMLALGVHEHFLASSLLGVVAQRLVRTLCPNCRVAVDMTMSPFTFEDVRKHLDEGEGDVVYGPGKCEQCYHTGYVSRRGVFEILPVDRDIRKLIAAQQPTSAVHEQACKEGMLEFRQAALISVAKGVTTMEEVLRAVPVEYLGVD